jgi:glycosyltransferase involved in cell wall biosynthesis
MFIIRQVNCFSRGLDKEIISVKNEKDSKQLKFCVLIPTYNNVRTLEQVITAVFEYTDNVIVVNDGSTDGTAAILERFVNQIEIITHPSNQGKGAALRRGLQRAGELGYEYAITLDADGQHLAADIPKFLAKVHPGEAVLIIGNRAMTGENILPKSIFGRKFSNFWVRLETGRDFKDTQSGYRLYTVAPINRIRFFTVKYDFELEALVRWVWRDYPVAIVEVEVYYPPPEARVSHFKGFCDNFYISLLNTALVTLTVVYMLPKRLFYSVVKRWKK